MRKNKFSLSVCPSLSRLCSCLYTLIIYRFLRNERDKRTLNVVKKYPPPPPFGTKNGRKRKDRRTMVKKQKEKKGRNVQEERVEGKKLIN